MSTRSDRLIAAGCVFGSLAAYLLTLCPTTYLGDSGEICVAVATGGVIHPPGYPLFTLLAEAALRVVPFGEPAYRIGVLVAVAAALTNGVVYLLARRLEVSPAWAAGAALFHGFSYTFWSQSVRVEVYSLHLLLFAAAHYFAVGYQLSGAPGDLRRLAVCLGLGLAHHLTLVLALPGLAVLVAPRLWREAGRVRLTLEAAACALPGLLLYGLLLVRARAAPGDAWGGTVDLPALWSHVSGRVYQGRLGPPDAQLLGLRLRELQSLVRDHYATVGVLLPIGALTLLLTRRTPLVPGLGGQLAVSALATTLLVTAYNFSYRIGDIVPYFLGPLLWLALLGAVFCEHVTRQRRLPARWTWPMALLLAGITLGRNWASCDLSRATWVREFARQKLEHAEPNAILITHEDADSFPIWYVHGLLGVRPDVTPIDFGMLRYSYRGHDRDASGWYLRRLARAGLPIDPSDAADPETRRRREEDGGLFDLLTGPLAGRPVFATFVGEDDQGGAGFWRRARSEWEFLPVGLLLHLHPKSRPVDIRSVTARSTRLWSGVQLPPRATRLDQELTPEYVTRHYRSMLLNLAGLQELIGDREGAIASYRRLLAWEPYCREASTSLSRLGAP